MIARSLETEVCVIGAGPAGAVAAMKLARLGHRVMLLRGVRTPGPRVGEALSEGVTHQLELLELPDLLTRAGARRMTSTVRAWASPKPERTHDQPHGFIVDRNRFDDLLIDSAVERGVCVLQGVSARAPTRTSTSMCWRVPVRIGGSRLDVHATFVIDATGRNAVSRPSRLADFPKTLALHADWPRPPDWAEDARVEALPDAWLWGAARTTTHVSAFVFMAADQFRRLAPLGAHAICKRAFAASSLFQGLATVIPTSRPRVRDATCSHDPDPIQPGLLRIGEAALTLDPLSSSGVQQAMHSGWNAAFGIHTMLRAPEHATAAEEFILAQHAGAVRQQRTFTRAAFSAAWPDGIPFWTARKITVPRPETKVLPRAMPSWSSQVCFTGRIEQVPCLVGELVERRAAVVHHALDRPLAFLNGVALAPLLEGLHRPSDIRRLICTWSVTLGAHTATAILRWLLHHQVLVEYRPSAGAA
jgi:flavin-dependent dehydrogenase